MYPLRSCPVCQRRDAHLLHTIQYPAENDRILPTEYRIVSCCGCGMVFDDFDAEEAAFARYYSSAEKYSLSHIVGSGEKTAEAAIRFQRIADFIAPFITDKNALIADIGCGRGELLNELSRRGLKNLCAVDNSPKCIEYIKQHTNWKTIRSMLEELTEELNFDFIICSQIFEHLFSPPRALQILSRILTPAGMIFIEVPNARCYEKFIYKPYHYFDAEHINHFSIEHLSLLLQTAGFEVITSGEIENVLLSEIVYPDCYVLARKTDNRQPPVNIETSSDYREKISLYLKKSAEIADNRQQFLHAMDPARKYFLWGLGAYGLKLINSGAFDTWNIAGLIDIDPSKHGKVIRGYRVYGPEILHDQENCGVCIISAIYEKQIRQQLTAMGFSGDIASV